MTRPPFAARAAYAISLFALGALALLPGAARAEKTLVKEGDWTLFTDGRVGAFASYVNGQGRPLSVTDPATGAVIHTVVGGGYDPAATAREPVPGSTTGQVTQGTIEEMRIRSGFIANTWGFGLRGPIGYSTVTGYVQLWILAETTGRTKNYPNIVEARQAYARLDGWWGTMTIGRQRALFSRGATDIDVMYAHRFGLGSPGNLEGNGPTAGHIGFGVLGSGFAPGFVYATPVAGGLQLTVGAYDPIQVPAGGWTRTKYVRPEAELTFERPLGSIGKIALFVNGAYQRLYHDGTPDSDHDDAVGGGAGGRLELGPVHLGAAGHYGKGLGLGYALETSEANTDRQNKFRKFDGWYLQSQFVLSPRVDVSAGWGRARVHLNPIDNVPDETGNIPSVIKYQDGKSAGVVFHARPWLHFDIDFFRADFVWFYGQKQVVYIANGGMTYTW